MEFDDVASLIVIGAILVLGVACIVSVIYVRHVNGERTEPSRYLDMLVARDTRVGLGQAVLLAFTAFVVGRGLFPDQLPRIGPGVASIWLGISLLLMGWGPCADALQFRRDRALGRQIGSGE